MKLSIIVFVSLCFSAFVFGQDEVEQEQRAPKEKKTVELVSKRGISILPKAGDFALGVDAYPFFYYLGGIFSQNNASAPYFSYGQDFGGFSGIFGKYMLDDDLAVRVNFRGDFNSYTDIYVVPKSTLTFDPMAPQYVEDEVTTSNNSLFIAAGLEKMRGSSRVQGKYGAELIVGYAQNTTNYYYGNAISNDFQTPAIYSNNYVNGSERIIYDFNDRGIFAGLRGFIGLEYFIAPKFSIGGEFGYSFMYWWSQNRIQEYQYWDGAEQKTSTVVRESNSNGYSDFDLGIDQLDGSITLFFYF